MKTEEQKQTEVLNYFNETSKHLFVTNTGVMFKIITFKNDGILYYSKLVINKEKASIETHEAFKYGMGLKQSWKHHFFPNYLNVKANPHFKKFNEIEYYIKPKLSSDNTNNQKLLDEVINRFGLFQVETK